MAYLSNQDLWLDQTAICYYPSQIMGLCILYKDLPIPTQNFSFAICHEENVDFLHHMFFFILFHNHQKTYICILLINAFAPM